MKPFGRIFPLAALVLVLAGPVGYGQDPLEEAYPESEAGALPAGLEGVSITEKLREKVPLDLEFTDERGRTVRLGDYFKEGKPVILTLNYYGCPMLCGVQLNGLLETLREMDWTAGREFEIVTVSFDPRETPALAKRKQQNYLSAYERPEAADGWHFLTGRLESIRAITGATGFGYRWVEERQEYAHAAALIILSPDGMISRYLYGVMYEPKTLRLSLVEASEGRAGSTIDRILLFCFHYDASEGKYTPQVMRIVRAAGAITVVGIATLLGSLWRRDVRRRQDTVSEPKESENP